MSTKEGLKAPVNTSGFVSLHPLSGLVAGTPEGIPEQEESGQHSFVESNTLPTQMHPFGGHDPKAVLEAAGVKFLGGVEGDALFQYVELPQGWKIVPTEHPLWSHLVDRLGRKRALIFYKAAFYDRRAHLILVTRFAVRCDNVSWHGSANEHAHVMDGDKVIHTISRIVEPGDPRGRSVDDANSWLDQNYPDWRNPAAYWD